MLCFQSKTDLNQTLFSDQLNLKLPNNRKGLAEIAHYDYIPLIILILILKSVRTQITQTSIYEHSTKFLETSRAGYLLWFHYKG